MSELVGQSVWFSVVILEYFGEFKPFMTLAGVVFAFVVVLIQVEPVRTSMTRTETLQS